jgi:large subunit ribosomal protein L16
MTIKFSRPDNTKFNKQQKGRKFNKIKQSLSLYKLCNYKNRTILKALNHGRITEKLLITVNAVLIRKVKKKGRYKIRLATDVPITTKPLEVRMGKGKGEVDYWISKVRPGMTIIEINDCPRSIAETALLEIQKKLPIKTYIDFCEI